MVKQPSAIIIVRHGTRLDQADQNWQATADHPYDPPLSYGGWIQCQTLGARIDRELSSLAHLTPDLSSTDPPPPRKRRKIVIHSSPYKRCVQTSIAIAAGLRYPTNDRVRPLPTPFQRQFLRSNESQAAEPEDEKIELKIDPCLGEWLSTSYFEDSKEPPQTDIIVERAKETMTRPLEEIRGADLNAFLPVAEAADEEDEPASGLKAMAAAGHALAHRPRQGTSPVTQLAQNRARKRANTLNLYSPPVPQYALAPQDSIPAGYVAHARDGCVFPNTEWDSEKMGWGDAGTYPEEWSVMHVRFRLALQKILGYHEDYSTGLDVEDELVLVLVTHQAGANALIRLMTGAPALHDVGVASLTLAVRRPVLRRPPSLSNTSHSPLGYDRENRARRGSLDLGLADDFEMRIIASTEHLRMGSNPLGLNSPRLGQSPAMAARRHTAADSLEGFSIGDSLASRPNANGMTRSASQRSRGVDGPKITTSGLWGLPAAGAKTIKEDDDEVTPMSPKSRPTTPLADFGESIVASPVSRSRSSTMQSAGLWGGGNVVPVRNGSGTWMPQGAADGTWMAGSTNRNRSPAKRRWTAVSNTD